MAIRTREIDDYLLITVTLMLVAMGALMVLSTSHVMAVKKYGNGYVFIKKHLVFAFAGLMVFIIASRVPYTIYRKLAYPALILAAIGLFCIYLPGLGHTAGGARRWVKLGPITFQPSEPAKLAVIFFLAYSLSAKADRIKEFSFGFLPNVLIPGAIIGLIVMEPDLGTAVTLSTIVGVMCFAGGVRLRYLAGAVALAAVPAYFIIHKFGYMMTRLKVFVDPWSDPGGAGFQTVQSFIAFGSGGIWGTGLGEGRQKLFYLPEAHTDFIFSVIGEELGLIGVAAVVALYAAFFVCGMRIALRAKSLYGKYLALGLTLMVTLQATVNMAVVMGLLPPKGLTLPFVSYGGTSLVVNMAAAGVLLNIYITESEGR